MNNPHYKCLIIPMTEMGWPLATARGPKQGSRKWRNHQLQPSNSYREEIFDSTRRFRIEVWTEEDECGRISRCSIVQVRREEEEEEVKVARMRERRRRRQFREKLDRRRRSLW